MKGEYISGLISLIIIALLFGLFLKHGIIEPQKMDDFCKEHGYVKARGHFYLWPDCYKIVDDHLYEKPIEIVDGRVVWR